METVLVTGAGGYIGSVLVRELLDAGHKVVAMDRFYFGEEPLVDLVGNDRLSLCKQDVRDATEADFAGVTAVCDLAALSNDPSGEIDPELTIAINHKGRAHIANVSKRAGVKRYILASSCSVYGTGVSRDLDETAPTAPLTTYAACNLNAEEDALRLSDADFSVTVLRNATVFGLSRRMRFDLAVNIMTLHAAEKGEITVMGGGRQWRPLVHVHDVARAFLSVLEASDPATVNGEIFNVGLTNMQVRSLAYIVRETLPIQVNVKIAPDDPDKRDYHVSFEKAKKVLGYHAKSSIEDGVREIYEALKYAEVEHTPKTVTVQWYKTILEAKKLVSEIELDGRIL